MSTPSGAPEISPPTRSLEAMAGATSVEPGRTSSSWAHHWQPSKKSLLLPTSIAISRLQIHFGKRIRVCRSQSSDIAAYLAEESQEEDDATDFSEIPKNILAAEREVHGNLLIDMVEKYPDSAGTSSDCTDSTFSASPSSHINSTAVEDHAMYGVIRLDENGHLSPKVSYLLNIGMDLDSIRKIVRKYPAFNDISVDRKIKPVVDLLLDLGISKHLIPKIITKSPQLCGISLTENLKPTMLYLESIGVDEAQWAKIIIRYPGLLTISRQKTKSLINFLLECGVPEENIGKILTRCPNILGCSVEKKLRPVSQYFTSLGVDVASLIQKCPQNFGLSIEANLKPVTKFLEEKGFSIEEIGTMVNRLGTLYMLSLEDNLVPKWEYFLTMGYPRSELVKFPHYFGYNMEGRIKPRFNRVEECGLSMSLCQMLATANCKFEDMLEKKMKKLDRLVKLKKKIDLR